MRLAIVTHKVIKGDGQGRVNYEVAKVALQRGHRIVLVASEVEPELESRKGLEWIKISVEEWPTTLLRNQVFAWRSYRWLRGHRERIDLMLANGCITWEPAHVNVVHFVHSTWLRSPVHTSRTQGGVYAWYQWIYTALNAWWERFAFRQAKCIVAVSEQVRGELVQIGVPRHLIRVIPNGVDLAEFFPGNADRERLGFPEEGFIGLFVGDLQTPRKNLDTVLKALKNVEEMHLIVVGTVEDSPYPTLTEELDVADRVYFLGFRRDVPEIMRSVDLCLCPSRYEPFSLVVLEALATGLPVITAKEVGAAQLVSSDCGVVLEDSEDVDALVRVLKELVGNPERINRMGKAARAVAERHSFTRMATQYLDLCEELYQNELSGKVE